MMIGRLCGTLAEVVLTRVLLDVNGVGYDVSIPLSTYEKLPPCNQKCTLLIHTNVREDAIELFGFASQEERALFLMLIAVSGVGPKSALNILSCLSVSAFASAIVNNDLKMLQRINGIGKKSAERLVVELRDKLANFAVSDSTTADALPPAANDAVLALERLGFKHESVVKCMQKVVKAMTDKEMTSENCIRKALAALNG